MVFNEAAPISSLVTYVNTLATTALSSVAGNLISMIMPFGAVVFGIYVILMMWGYMRGSETDPVQDFLAKLFCWSIVIGYGLNANTYTNEILPIVTGLGSDFLKLSASGSDASAMDTLFNSTIGLIGSGIDSIRAKTAGSLVPDFGGYFVLLLQSIILLVGVVPFLISATTKVIFAGLGSQIVAAIGPLFFLSLLFPATRQYFSAWLNTALSYALIPLFVAVITMLAMQATNGILDLQAGQTLAQVSFAKILFVAIANWVVMFMLQQVTSMASSLSSGGINAGMPSGSIAGAIKSGVKGSIAGYKGTRALNHARLDRRHERQNRKNSIKNNDNKPKAS